MSAVHCEWTKLRTVPSTAWLLLGTIAGMVVLSTMVTAAIDTSLCPSPTECFEDTTKLSLSGVHLGQMAVVVLAVLTVTNEYGTGMIHTTLTARPQRVRVLLAKAGVVTAAVLGAGMLGVLGSLLAGRIILPGNGFTAANGYPPLSLADGPTLRAAGGTVLYCGLIALLAVGVGTLIRDTAAAIATVLSLLYLFPIVGQFISNPQWNMWIQRYAPMNAGLAVQSTIGLDRLPIGPWAGLGVLATWSAAALVAGTAMFVVRDA
jgi:ABC-2 type transport system permease protein